jgi:hypothetical protein
MECICLNSRWEHAHAGPNAVIDKVLIDFEECRSTHDHWFGPSAPDSVSAEIVLDFDEMVHSVHSGANYAIWHTRRQIKKHADQNARVLGKHSEKLRLMIASLQKDHSKRDKLIRKGTFFTVRPDGSVYSHYAKQGEEDEIIQEYVPRKFIDLAPFGHTKLNGFVVKELAAIKFRDELKRILNE